jgi:glucose-6-phosphate isomerase
MSYYQNLEGCYHYHGQESAINDLLTSEVLKEFQAAAVKGAFPPVCCVNHPEEIPLFQQAAERLAHFEDILIFGTGGSSLGGKTLYALSSQEKPRLHFIDNIDPHTFMLLFQRISIQKTGVLVVSKSGSTVETLMQMLTLLQHFGPISPSQVLVITEPKDNPLRALAEKHHWACLDHPVNVGGRYSCFSVVGLIPLILAGLDPIVFHKGGQDVLKDHLNSPHPSAFLGAAMGVYLEKYQHKTLSVMMPYADQLNSFSFWYRQLWAESVGKEGKGTTPIQALGTVDQHSQLQLYLEGPKDKFFTLLGVNWENKGPRIESLDIPEFTGKTMGELLLAEQKATYQTLLNHNCPTRLITLDRLDEYHLGALMMHFIIETILAASFLQVNAFDQPAVEEGKKLAREYLNQK